MTDYIAEYVKHLVPIRAAATVDTYRDILRRIDRELRPYGLAGSNAAEIEACIWDGTRTPATLAVYRAAVVDFFRWITHPDVDLLDFDPSPLLPKVKVPAREPRPVPDDEVCDILGRAAEPYRTWYLLARYAGLRCCEIAALLREEISRQRLRVIGKGGKERSIPTHPDVWDAVCGLPVGPVARTPGGAPTTRRQIKDRGNRHLRRTLGYPEVTMHRFRHTFGTQVYRNADPFVAQKLLGHASVQTTLTYAAVASEAMAAAVAALPRVGAR